MQYTSPFLCAGCELYGYMGGLIGGSKRNDIIHTSLHCININLKLLKRRRAGAGGVCTIGLPVLVHVDVKLDFGVVCDWITSLRNALTRARVNLPRNSPPFVCARARSHVAVNCSTVPRVAQRLCRKPKCFFLQGRERVEGSS